MRTLKANSQGSKLRVATLGDSGKTLSLNESGLNVIITAAPTAHRTITLPPVANVRGAKGAYFRIVWGVSSANFNWVIATGAATEYIVGTAFTADTNGTDDYTGTGSDGGNLMAACATKAALADTRTTLTLNDVVTAGSMIEFTSDGSNWYISNCKIVGTNAADSGAVPVAAFS